MYIIFQTLFWVLTINKYKAVASDNLGKSLKQFKSVSFQTKQCFLQIEAATMPSLHGTGRLTGSEG